MMSLFTSYMTAQTLYSYGGKNNETYLGCFNCNDYDSVWNE